MGVRDSSENNQSNDISIDTVEDNENDEDDSIKKIQDLVNKVKLLNYVLKTKDDIIQFKELENRYLDNKTKNLESLLTEKDNVITDMTRQIKEISSLLLQFPMEEAVEPVDAPEETEN